MRKLLLSVVAALAVCAVSAQGVVEKYNAGAKMMQAKDFAGAAKNFEQVIAEGQTSEDGETLNLVETAKKYLPVCYRSLGTRAAAAKNYEEAIAQLTRASQTAELYGNVDDMKKSNTILAKVYQVQGGEAFNNKEWAKAAEVFAKGYAANDKNAEMANWLGTCYCEMAVDDPAKYDEGMAIFEKVAAMKGPRFEKDAAEAKRLMTLYTMNRVASLQQAKDNDGIVAMADKMIADGTNVPLAKKIRLQAFMDKQDYAKVIEDGEDAAAAQVDPAEQSDVYFILGAAYNAKEMKPQAIAALKKVVAGDRVEMAQKTVAELSK